MVIGPAVLAALGSAFFLAVAAALQQHAAATLPTVPALTTRGPLHPALLVDLARRPCWVVGFLTGLLGVGLQVVALSFGSLALVQPMVVTVLLFALPVGAVLQRKRPARADVLAAGAVALGLGGLLVSLHVGDVAPAPNGALLATVVAVLAAGVAVTVLGTSVVSRPEGTARTVLLASAAGVCFGITAALVQVVAHAVRSGGLPAALSWMTVVAAVSSLAGLLLSQAAYRAGRLPVALAVTLVADPLVAVGIGAVALGEPLHASRPALVVAEALLTLVGIMVLARGVRTAASPMAGGPAGDATAGSSGLGARRAGRRAAEQPGDPETFLTVLGAGMGAVPEEAMPPRRILLISADLGAGHDATGRALEQTARRLWPRCEIRWVDTLDAMGPGVGRACRRTYVSNVQSTPWLYEFLYECLWRYGWFATAAKRLLGFWCGRRFAPVIEDHDPDLIVSTYLFANAGLHWLRRNRGLDVPTAAWIPDFAPHPLWMYSGLDTHFVMHGACVRLALAAEPAAVVSVAAPPVVEAFRPGDRLQARRALGLDENAFTVVISCGSYGFGTVETAVQTLLDADPDVHVVAICGSNEPLRARLLARAGAADRLVPLGWVDSMPMYMRAADMVVTNGNGATALEALVTGRALVIFDPIPAHGRANAELMAESGLAAYCEQPGELTWALWRILDRPGELQAMEHKALAYTRAREVDDDLRLLAGSPAEQHALA